MTERRMEWAVSQIECDSECILETKESIISDLDCVRREMEAAIRKVKKGDVSLCYDLCTICGNNANTILNVMKKAMRIAELEAEANALKLSIKE